MTDVIFGVPGAVEPFDEPRLIAATIGGVRVYSIYAPNGRKVDTDAHRFKLSWFEFFAHVLERVACRRLIDLGLVDVIRSRAGETPAFTWWNRRGDFYETDRGWRLDHARASPAVAARVSTASVDRLARSEPGPDHTPIMITLGERLRASKVVGISAP
jgi:exodeoxyribonuclease III